MNGKLRKTAYLILQSIIFECFIPFHCAWLFIVVIIVVIVVYLCQTLRKGLISITTLKDYEIFTKILRKFEFFFQLELLLVYSSESCTKL